MSRLVLFAALAGCVGGPPGAAQLIEGLGPLHTAEQSCLLAACEFVDAVEELAACRAERCAYTAETWTLRPTAIRHEGETVFVQAALGYTPGKYGFVQAQRPREAYVGVTVVTSAGAEIDLAVSTVFADQLGESFTLSTDVGPDVRDVIFGVWDRKIAPCDSERSGCKEFGFLLDGSLATWPPTVYVDGTRQRIPPAAVDLLVLDAGVGPELAARRAAVVEALSAELSVFGSAIGQVHTRRAERSTPGVQIMVADDHDLLLARNVAAALQAGGPVVAAAIPAPDAPAPVVVTLGGTAYDAGVACLDLADVAYDACLAEPR
jgi:hypothetical protein